ncbi:hypothetical protein PS009_24145, partial [Shigella sonnei]|nr:hypothetical protein [Shigella sonnei]
QSLIINVIKHQPGVVLRLDDMPAAQHYARLVIDDIDNQALITPLTPEPDYQCHQSPAGRSAASG